MEFSRLTVTDKTLLNKFEQEVISDIKPSYSNIEKIISLYVSLCDKLSYNAEVSSYEIIITNREINYKMFIDLISYFLNILQINYNIYDNGNILIIDGEYKISIPCEEEILKKDIDNLESINGLIPICDLEISDKKFNEKCVQMLETINEEKDIINESFEASTFYNNKYVTNEMLFLEKIKLFYQELGISYYKGQSVIEHYSNLFNIIFNENDNVELGFLYDHGIQDKLFDNTPFVVIRHTIANNFFVIHPGEVSKYREFSYKEFYKYISSEDVELLNKRCMELGDTNDRETKTYSK